MFSGIPIKKLFKIAVLTTVILVAALAVMPHVMPFKFFSIRVFFNSVFLLGVVIFCAWFMNIGLLYTTERTLKGRWRVSIRYLLSYSICMLIVFAFEGLINSFVHDPARASAHLYLVYIFLAILNTIILITQDLILLRERKTLTDLDNAELRIKNIEAVNLHLKQQIHPHFLFNSLSTLKTLIKREPVKAEEYLTKLADILRAAMLTDKPSTVLVGDELKLCMDYLEMQQMRFGSALNFEINIPKEVQSQQKVPTFSILPLLENAIKHNSFTYEEPLRISISYKDHILTVSNNIQSRKPAEISTGLGLENLSERYKILSGDAIVVSIDSYNFSVSIKTLSDEYSNSGR